MSAFEFFLISSKVYTGDVAPYLQKFKIEPIPYPAWAEMRQEEWKKQLSFYGMLPEEREAII